LAFTMNKPGRSKQLPSFRSDVKAWHNKGSVLVTFVLVFFAGPMLEELWPSDGSLPPAQATVAKGEYPLLVSSDSGTGTYSAPPYRFEFHEVKGLLGGHGDDGGRFGAQGTAGRAVKCFDPCQDHQRRKH